MSERQQHYFLIGSNSTANTHIIETVIIGATKEDSEQQYRSDDTLKSILNCIEKMWFYSITEYHILNPFKLDLHFKI